MSLIKSKEDKEEFTTLITDIFKDVMIPALDAMEGRLASKKDLSDLSMQVQALDRKFDAQQERQDRHNARIENLEEIHPQGRHLATV